MALRVLTPPASQLLVTLDEAKAELGVEGGAQDAALNRRIEAASDSLAHMCGRPEGFGRAEVEETICVMAGAQPLRLARDLEPEVLAVTEGNMLLAADDWLLSAGGELFRLGLNRRAGWWAWGQIRVRYRGGLDCPNGVPAILRQAALAMVAMAHHSAGRDPAVRSEKTEGVGSTDFFQASAVQAAALDEVGAAVNRFRRIAFV